MADYREFNTLIGNPVYTAADRARMRDLLVGLDVYYVNVHGAVRRRDTRDAAVGVAAQEPRQLRPATHRPTQDVEIEADGRGSMDRLAGAGHRGRSTRPAPG